MNEYLKSHIRINSGYDFTKHNFSDGKTLSKTIGEGFVFTLSDGKYITKADIDKDGKRIIKFNITSFGEWSGGVHYYCKAISDISNINIDIPSAHVSGYCEGLAIPAENQMMIFNLVRPLTTDELQLERWELYCEGDLVEAFNSKDEIIEIINMLKKNVFNEAEWKIEIYEDYF